MAVVAVAEVYQEGAATVVMNQLFCVTDQLFFFFFPRPVHVVCFTAPLTAYMTACLHKL